MNPIRRLQRAIAAQAHASEADVARLVLALAKAHAQRWLTSTDPDRERLLVRLQAAISRAQVAGDLGGRLELRYGALPLEPETLQQRAEPDLVPWVAFTEAIRDMEARDPIGAETLRSLGLEVEDAYRPFEQNGVTIYPHAFAAAKAADAETAARVQTRLAEGLAQGLPTEQVAKLLTKDWDWPGSYARTVVRTNYATATSAGRFREADRVASMGVRVGFVFQTAGDSSVRETHRPMDGVVARVDDPIWERLTPPLAFNCRCLCSPRIGSDVPEGFVRAPSGARAEPGFGMRPDRATYR